MVTEAPDPPLPVPPPALLEVSTHCEEGLPTPSSYQTLSCPSSDLNHKSPLLGLTGAVSETLTVEPPPPPEVVASVSVSYTHLTLPTIVSV